MIDIVRGEGEEVGLLLEANFADINEARSVLLPPHADRKYPTLGTNDLTWELLGEAVSAEVYDYESLNDLWEDETWPDDEPSGRLVNHAGRSTLRMPTNWPWANTFTTALTALRELQPATG